MPPGAANGVPAAAARRAVPGQRLTTSWTARRVRFWHDSVSQADSHLGTVPADARHILVPAGARGQLMLKRNAATIILSLAAVASGAGCNRTAADDDAATRPVAVKHVAVELRRIERPVESVGSLFPFEEVTVSAEVEGRVDRVLVDIGDRVARGQPLVQVSPVELRLARAQQQAALEQTKARLGFTAEGQARDDPREAAEVQRAAAEMKDADQKYRRARSLFDEGLIARGTFEEAEARYLSARAAHDVALQGVRDLQAELTARRAALELAGKKLSDAVIRAPFAGHIKQRMVAPGQFLRVQTPVVTIVNTDPLRVRLKVPERVAGRISPGEPVSVTVEAFPGRAFQGKVSRLSPSVDTQTRSLEVEALLDNGEGLLKPGFFARAVVATNETVDSLFVPFDAVRYVFGVYKVFTVEQGVVREREVKLGARAGEDVEILEGLQAGERVAVPAPGQELVDGLAVEASS
jgi:RND family efflux transporter MFP subunit